MGLLLGHSAWQIDQPSDGSMLNFYSFQPIGPWIGYSFSDLGAKGYCRSLNDLLYKDADNARIHYICIYIYRERELQFYQ